MYGPPFELDTIKRCEDFVFHVMLSDVDMLVSDLHRQDVEALIRQLAQRIANDQNRAELEKKKFDRETQTLQSAPLSKWNAVMCLADGLPL